MANTFLERRRSSLRNSGHAQKLLGDLLSKTTYESAFTGKRYNSFSDQSVADVFDVTKEGGTLMRRLTDDAISSILQEPLDQQGGSRMRLIFLDGILEDPDRLPITAPLLQEMFDAYEVDSRFADMLVRQHMPGSGTYRNERRELLKHEIWYSAVIRFFEKHSGYDLSRKVVEWQRFCAWSDFRPSGDSYYVLWRCPIEIKEAFYKTFSGPDGARLLEHPMLVHGFLMDRIVMHTYDFLEFFSEPLYTWELGNQLTPNYYTDRLRAFLQINRQIHQVATDHDILEEAVNHLKKQLVVFKDMLTATETASQGPEISYSHEALDAILENLTKEVRLVRTYTHLYLERSNIGVNECIAIINQRDSEANLQMAEESTGIARVSYDDNKSLRIIQILTMIFLPGSFIASIFGMGFFSTDQNDAGIVAFAASTKIWIYFALSVPLTAIVMALVYLSGRWKAANARKSSSTDTEANMELSKFHKWKGS